MSKRARKTSINFNIFLEALRINGFLGILLNLSRQTLERIVKIGGETGSSSPLYEKKYFSRQRVPMHSSWTCSSLPLYKSLNYSRCKYLHFKWLSLACIMFDTVAATEMGPVCSRMPPSGTSGHFVTASRTWSTKKKKKVYNVTTSKFYRSETKFFSPRGKKSKSHHRFPLNTATLRIILDGPFRYQFCPWNVFNFHDMTSLKAVRASMKSLRIISNREKRISLLTSSDGIKYHRNGISTS